MNARAREESICTRTLNSNTKYVIAFALAILVHRTARYLHTSKEHLLGWLYLAKNKLIVLFLAN
jgi:hypothetical protein